MTRHPWYSPTAWVSRILFEVAARAPEPSDMIVAALWGAVEICGIKRVSSVAIQILMQKLRGGNVSQN